MLEGKTAVFLSCSERYKQTVAYAFRDAVEEEGWFAIIVADLPKLEGAWDPDDKVEGYLRRADMFVALSTPDDELADGTWRPRENVIDEIARARTKDHLADRMCILKEPTTTLPSNLNPAYERMVLDDLQPAIRVFLSQAATWGFRPQPEPREPGQPPAGRWRELFDGIQPGEPHKAYPRVRDLLRGLSKAEQRTAVSELSELVESSTDWETVSVAGYFLEAIAEIDAQLISVDLLEELAEHGEHAARIEAAVILFLLACTSPALVPIDLVARLAQPTREDWYVSTPALSTLKQLSLSRPEALAALDALARSKERDDREYAAAALRDVARIRPEVIPLELAGDLSVDGDPHVTGIGREILELLRTVHEEDRRHPYSPFTPF